MSSVLPTSLQNLITEFGRLPGIGQKSAERLSFYLMKQSTGERNALAHAVSELTKSIVTCTTCHNIAESDPCTICANNSRDEKTICVVEEPWDVIAIESTHEYKGLYHVLHGALSPIDNINPENLKINELVLRAKKDKEKPEEVIIATNPSLEGEATAMYIVKLLRPLNINTTRIARGLPVGSDLEYADEITIGQALLGRREM
ncbi:recombination mediator RecR [Patescibacteria group bacterium]|nr:recombination mediator RecR [Patescibacteria group bacterium]